MPKRGWVLTTGLVGNLAAIFTALTLAGPWWLRFTYLGIFLLLVNASLIFWTHHRRELWHGHLRSGRELAYVIVLDLVYLFWDVGPAVHDGLAVLWQVANVVNYLTLALAGLMIGQWLTGIWHSRRHFH